MLICEHIQDIIFDNIVIKEFHYAGDPVGYFNGPTRFNVKIEKRQYSELRNMQQKIERLEKQSQTKYVECKSCEHISKAPAKWCAECGSSLI